MSIESTIAKLKGVKRDSNGWKSLCPAHKDKTASLSIALGDSGNVVLHCHAGCTWEQIRDAAGLAPDDTSGPPGQVPTHKPGSAGKTKAKTTKQTFETSADAIAALETNRGPVSKTWTYRNVEGEPIGVVCRWNKGDGKEIRPVSLIEGKWHARGMPHPHPLFNLDLLAKEPTRRVYVTEGEKCAEAMGEIGLLATTSPHGSNSAGKVRWNPVAGREVVFLPDNDQAGELYVETSLHELWKLKTNAATPAKIVKFAGLGEGGDVFDFVALRRAAKVADDAIRNEIEALADCAEVVPPHKPEIELLGHGYTDFGNARRFVAEHGAGLRYCAKVGGWYTWTGQIWADDETHEVERLAKLTVTKMHDDALMLKGDEAEALLRHAEKSESMPRLGAMLVVARSEKPLIVTLKELNADPWLLSVANGTLDLRTGVLREHRQGDLITKVCPTEFVPEAKYAEWDNFLEFASRGDSDVREFMQRAAGYSMTGITKEEKLFMVHGLGGSGKSTFVDAIKAALEGYAMTADAESFIHKDKPSGGQSGDIARLNGARLVVTNEIDRGKRLAHSLVKAVTGRDTIVARGMFQSEIEFRPTFKLWMVFNHPPQVDDDDTGMWRRILRIPFPEPVADGVLDEGLKERLQRLPEARSAVLWWLLEGCRNWQEVGLSPPPCITEATKDYRADMDPLKEFVENRCEVGNGWEITSVALRNAYAEFCRAAGQKKILSPKEFGTRLTSRGCKSVHRHDGNHWIGIALRPVEADPNMYQGYSTHA